MKKNKPALLQPEEFEKIQSEVLEKVFRVSPQQKKLDIVEDNNFLKHILSCDKEICSFAFGSIGERLHNLAQNLDLDHPEVQTGEFLSSFTHENGCEKIIQFIKLCDLAIQNNLTVLDKSFTKSVTKSIFPNVKFSMNLLRNRQQFVRLFADASTRARLRKLKEVREVTTMAHRVVSAWESVGGLKSYERFGNFYEDQIKESQKRADLFKEYGMSGLRIETQKIIKEIGSAKEYKYYGFQRVSMTVAALALARMHDSTLRNDFIQIPASLFDFDFEHGSLEPANHHRNWYEYHPMIFPVHKMENNDKMEEIVSYLESFPEANGKPIFDHYVALVPGVYLPAGVAYYDTSRNYREFDSEISAHIAFNLLLIKKKCIVPALLGEKDGKFYFICFWE
ncbi:MAG: hypothetical protein DWQ19_10615 [Crenarchaeota archaeon]|nr:MAG: hypothetical protein DWQ19_10615 [Thermoproteota archaeon]